MYAHFVPNFAVGVERQWETCQRTTRKGVADAVAIFATIRATASTPAKIILVSQVPAQYKCIPLQYSLV